MATISFQVAETGQTTATKTYTLPDAQLDRMIAAYQQGANTSINGTATRAQVLNYWSQVVIAAAVAQVQAFETQQATTTATSSVTPITPV